MAKRVAEIILGVDVSRDSLDLFGSGWNTVRRIKNRETAIVRCLDELPGPVVLAVEATGAFHETLVELALDRGCEVYLVDGYRLSRYREAVGLRAKTDATDARLIYRYLKSERQSLRPVQALDQRERQLWRVLKRRATVVQARCKLRQSLRDLEGVAELGDVFKPLDQLELDLTRWARRLARSLGWSASLKQLRTIPGVGELAALALRAMYGRGRFDKADQFIAFLGLDVRVRDSGCFRGQRKLTKKGDPEVRRILFNGARSAAYRQPYWAQLKANYQARGLTETEISVILSRKLARIGYAILRDGSAYVDPLRA